jgi:hypothetical protein
MILYIEDLLRKINIRNWYLGEARKNADPDAVFVQSDADAQDILLDYMQTVVNDVLLFTNANRVKFTCEQKDDMLTFSLSPLREGREHLLDVLKEAIRQYIVYEIRRLWMMEVKPDWADSSLRESLRENIRKAMNDVTAMGQKVRRRYSWI